MGDPATPTVLDRIKNIVIETGRGIFGSIPLIAIPILLMPPLDMVNKTEKTVAVVWMAMFFCLLIHPVSVPVVGFMPVFLFPLLHVAQSTEVTKLFFSANAALMIVGGYLNKLINMSGFDKRFVMWMVFPSPESSISPLMLIIKTSVAAFFLSSISERMHVVPFIMQYVVLPLYELEGFSNSLAYIMCNCVVTSSVLGSICFVNGALNVMFMRTLWNSSGLQDTFNFLDYTCFALPVSLAMLVFNLVYHIILITILVKEDFSKNLTKYRTEVLRGKDGIAESMTVHEILTIVFTVLSRILYMTRWGVMMKKLTSKRGWVDVMGESVTEKGLPKVQDVTVAAILSIICCILPISFNFIKLIAAKVEGDLPPAKPDSAILFWKFADKSTNYGYLFLMGGFAALNAAVRTTANFPEKYLHEQLKFLYEGSLPVVLAVVCFISVLLCNIMTAVGASGMITVAILNMIPKDNAEALKKLYLFVLASGMGTSFGFAPHFMYTPALYSSVIAKVPLVTQIKYSIGSSVICFVILWVSLFTLAPLIFEPVLPSEP